jgi:hypothetical protein
MMTAETTMTILLFVMFLCIATTIPVTIAKETATAETRSEQTATCTDATFENAKNDNGSKKQKGNSESWFDLLAQDPKLLFQKVLQDTATAAATAATSRSRSRPTKTTMSDTPSENENLFSKLEREHDTSSTNPKQQDFLQQLWTIFRNDDQQENERVLTDMLLQEKDHPNAHSTTAQILQLYGNSTDAVLQQLKDTFGDSVRLDRFDPLQVYYYMQHQEQVKNAVWKRQQHRYLPRLETSVAIQLADGLYLSHLSYVNTVLHVKEGLAAFKNNSWKLLFATTDSQPYQPAHFIAIHRELAPLQQQHQQQQNDANKKDWWNTYRFDTHGQGKIQQQKSQEDLHVAIVIRGTKGFGDFLTNGLLSLTDFMGGKAHEGMLKSACWLVNQTVPRLQQLLEQTGRRKVQLWLVGHSLGAGAAALAALEFNAQHSDWVQAHSLGFGTPPLVTRNVSIAAKHVVRTVINDADVVPRMSGGKLVKAWMAIAAHNWTAQAIVDVDQLLGVWKENAYFNIENILSQEAVERFQDWLKDALIKPKIIEPVTDVNASVNDDMDLIPPGTCIHLYRDGVSWQATDTPCGFFNELEVVRHMLDDHFTDTGYYRGLLSFVREQENNLDWQFDHNLLQLPV